MSRKSLLLMPCLLAAFCGLWVSTAVLADHDRLVMGIFPRRDAGVTLKMFQPMADLLTERLGQPVQLDVQPDFKSFWKGVVERRYDIVHFNQYHYVEAQQKYGYQVFLKNMEFGRDTVSGALIVRKDSNFESLSDLKGKAILFGGGPRAMQSYILATWLLRQAGLEDGDYTKVFAHNPPSAIVSAYQKKVDAAGSGDTVLRLDAVKNQIDISQMKYLARSQPLAHLPWAVKSDMSPITRRRIVSLLGSLDTHASGFIVLDSAELSGLKIATDADYNRHREIIKSVYPDGFFVPKGSQL